MRRLASLYVLIALVAFMATACGGIPLPEKAEQYSTWIENGEELDVVHAQFNIFFDVKAEFTSDDLIKLLSECSAKGTCGTLARLAVGGEFVDGVFSCSCNLDYQGEVVAEGSSGKAQHSILAKCVVPVAEGILGDEGVDYSLVITSVGTDTPDGNDLTFNSSPMVPVRKEMKVASLKFKYSF